MPFEFLCPYFESGQRLFDIIANFLDPKKLTRIHSDLNWLILFGNCWTRALRTAKFSPQITKIKSLGLSMGIKLHYWKQYTSVRNRLLVNLSTLGSVGGPVYLKY